MREYRDYRRTEKESRSVYVDDEHCSSPLPPHAKIYDDVKEIIQECVSEFISFVTSEANEKAHCEYQKTINLEDVIATMTSLVFDDYVNPQTVILTKYRDEDPKLGASMQ
ncbi:hypothetical protein MIMGU_mgv1a020054mg, partial [Erythranthe guttata]